MNFIPSSQTFRKRLYPKELLLVSFINSPSSHAIEILDYVGVDFVVIDQEHAPLDRAAAVKAICGFAVGADEARMLARSGVSAVVISSDQGLLRREAECALKEMSGFNK